MGLVGGRGAHQTVNSNNNCNCFNAEARRDSGDAEELLFVNDLGGLRAARRGRGRACSNGNETTQTT